MARTALEAVAEAIADHGPITFAEFMELRLYGPGGYYGRSPVGAAGDFVTSPHVHPVFGQLSPRRSASCTTTWSCRIRSI